MEAAIGILGAALGLTLVVSAPWFLLRRSGEKLRAECLKVQEREAAVDHWRNVAGAKADRVSRLEALVGELESNAARVGVELDRCAEPGSARDSIVELLQEAKDRIRRDREDGLSDDGAGDEDGPAG